MLFKIFLTFSSKELLNFTLKAIKLSILYQVFPLLSNTESLSKWYWIERIEKNEVKIKLILEISFVYCEMYR